MNELASIVVSGNNSNVVTAAASSTTGVIGICVFNCGTTGTAQIAREGVVSCSFDGAATPGDFVQAGSTAGECHDAGSAYPTNGHQVLGRVLNGGTSAGSFAMMFYPVETEPVPCPTCVTSSAKLQTILTSKPKATWKKTPAELRTKSDKSKKCSKSKLGGLCPKHVHAFVTTEVLPFSFCAGETRRV
ncbi:MAG: hypothetical protein WAL56_11940 [Candidatus Sulfotelmatobacter sp.]